jgi:flagellar hook-associated protein 2
VSDIMIPGITNSGFDTDGMVEQIMEAERISVTRMEQRIDQYEEEKAAWQEMGRRITNLREASRLLFGFENPFNDRIADSGDDSVVTATAERNASEGATEIKVVQLAQADRFLSRSLPEDFDVAPGRYGFRVGEQEEFFNFSGGTLEQLARSINQRASDIVTARVVRDTANTQVVLIEALQTGAANPLVFLEGARTFALEASLLEQVLDRSVTATIGPSTVTAWTKPLSGADVVVQNETVSVEPGAEAAIRLPGSIPTAANMVLEMEVHVENLWLEWISPTPPPGPSLPDVGGVTLGDVTVLNQPSSTPLPEWDPPDPPVVTDNMRFLYAQEGATAVPLPELSDTTDFETLRIPVTDYVASIQAVNVRNQNSHRRISIRNVKLYDPTSRGDLAPVNPISVAQDALLEIQGIRVERPTNAVDDLIEGVTLQLRSPSTRPVPVTVEPDREGVKNSLIDFVYDYNQLLTEINILTRNEEAVIDEITYFSDEEREEALTRLGTMQGDFTLSGLKSRLQTIMMNPYPTSAGSALTLLAQMGVSTNASGPGGGFETSRLRGYLEISESDLDSALQTRFSAIKELFGSDTDSDQVVDTGVGFEVDQLTRSYVQVGGIVATRTGTIDGSISQTETRVERENDRLVDREDELRMDFGRMEGALSNMRDNQATLDNLQTQTGGGQ